MQDEQSAVSSQKLSCDPLTTSEHESGPAFAEVRAVNAGERVPFLKRSSFSMTCIYNVCGVGEVIEHFV